MPDPKTVNEQIPDAVTQSHLNVLGVAPAQSMGLVYQSMAHSISLSMQNAVTAQNHMQQISTSTVSTACANILALAADKKT